MDKTAKILLLSALAGLVLFMRNKPGLKGVYKLIADFEGYRDQIGGGKVQAYPDVYYGWQVPTIGFGTTHYPGGQKVKKGDVISRGEAEYYLVHEAELKRDEIRKKSVRSLSKNQLDSLTSFAYNVGRSALFNSTLWALWQAGKPVDMVAAEFDKWVYSNGQVSGGLKRRRGIEKKLFLS